MLVAEDLLLLFYDDDSGKASFDGTKVDYGLAGAVLVELSMRGKVGIAGPGERVKEGRLVVLDDQPTGDDILDSAFAKLRDREGRKPKDTLGTMRKGLRDRLLNRLAERGLVNRAERNILGLFPVTRWPAADATHEAGIRDQLRSVLVSGVEPDERIAALVSLLVAVDGVTKVVPSDDKRATKRRAKEISESAWAGEAVRKAVQEVNTVVMAAIGAAAVAGTSGGS